jgi:hypothetical protein
MSHKKNRTKKKGGFIRSIYNYFKNKNIQKINDNYYKEHQEKIDTFKMIKINDVVEGDNCPTCTLYHFFKNEQDKYSDSIILRRTSNYYILTPELMNRMEDYCDNNATRNTERPIYDLRKSHTELEGFFADFKIKGTLFSELNLRKIPQYTKIFQLNTNRNDITYKRCRNHTNRRLPDPSTFFKVEPLKIEDIEIEHPNISITHTTVPNTEDKTVTTTEPTSINSKSTRKTQSQSRKIISLNAINKSKRVRLSDLYDSGLDFNPTKLSIIPESSLKSQAKSQAKSQPKSQAKSQPKSPLVLGPTISNINKSNRKTVKRKINNETEETQPTLIEVEKTQPKRKVVNRNLTGPTISNIRRTTQRKVVQRQ